MLMSLLLSVFAVWDHAKIIDIFQGESNFLFTLNFFLQDLIRIYSTFFIPSIIFYSLSFQILQYFYIECLFNSFSYPLFPQAVHISFAALKHSWDLGCPNFVISQSSLCCINYLNYIFNNLIQHILTE